MNHDAKAGPFVQQLTVLLREELPYFGINLTWLWRLAGPLRALDPSEWSKACGHLLHSCSQYLAAIDPEAWLPDPESPNDSLWSRTGGMLDVIPGTYASREDVTTVHFVVAMAYAVYLDRKLAGHDDRLQSTSFEGENAA